MSDFITVAELRIEAESLCDENDQLREENDQLREENAKLRELLADTLMDTRDYCAKYGFDYDGFGWNSANDDIDRRLRELGIEVYG